MTLTTTTIFRCAINQQGPYLILAAQQAGLELPMELIEKIVFLTIEQVPWLLELSVPELCTLTTPCRLGHPTRCPPGLTDPPLHGLYHFDYGRVQSMARAVSMEARDISQPSYPCGDPLTPEKRRSQQNFDLKTITIEMCRHQFGHQEFILSARPPDFDGNWLKFRYHAHPTYNLRKFELAKMWPTLYGKGGWAK